MRRLKKIIEDQKTKKDLQKRLELLEKSVASLKMSIEIAVDSRLSYLETNYTNIKRIKPQIEQICDDIKIIKGATSLKENKKDDKENMEVA
jgi:hypothetical protein